ncbi:hypothetical protein HY643_04120 [Candidatus Woesearchaeota archaeon]|nr:hypothetical protein [Candidatus Woesearchaeota archaeon]
MGKEKKNPIPVVEYLKIKKDGLFDYQELKNILRNWLLKFNYDFLEKKHDEKIMPTGKELVSEWGIMRKVSDYVKFNIEIEIRIRGMTTVMVEGKGKMNKGWLEILFNANIEKNYMKKFSEEKGTFSHFTKEIYEKYIIKAQLKNYEDKLLYEVTELHNEMKESLNAEQKIL